MTIKIERKMAMSKDNKMRSTKNGKKEDGKFRSKNIKHDQQAESARAVFGFQNRSEKEEK